MRERGGGVHLQKRVTNDEIGGNVGKNDNTCKKNDMAELYRHFSVGSRSLSMSLQISSLTRMLFGEEYTRVTL